MKKTKYDKEATASFSPDENEDNASMYNASLEVIAKHFENLPLMGTQNGQPSFQRDVVLKCSGKQVYDDAFGNCKTLLVDLPRAFQNFEPSETMERALTKPDLLRVATQYGGPLRLLQQIVSEMKIRTTFISPRKKPSVTEICYFLRFKFPYKFEIDIPNRAVVSGVGATEYLAKNNAALEGLKLLKSLFYG
ncbi:hypothetical protein Ocin01_05167 [Orchesella cincta]|uniref:Uncharacterized protein n=1 Tax=Orchesella cincta TaxID=48709 RepID=A0A1D2N8G7_ORCCI|nr:hypothetical protein Ocin01_05167 [Orchesella cincta]